MSDKTNSNFAPIGVPGLPAYGGRLFDEFDPRLQGDKLLRTYGEMQVDPTIRSFLFAFESLVRAAGHRFDPADDSPEAAAVRDFVADCLDDMVGAWGDTLSEILSCLAYGFSLFEVIYKRRDDGRIGWERWAPRAQETIWRWEWDDQWNVVAAVQLAPPAWRMIELPMERLLHFRILPRKQSPVGTSLLRSAYEPWYYTKHLQRIEAIGVERDLTGLPQIGLPIEVYNDPAKVATWLDVGQNLRRDEQACLILPNVYDPATGKPLYTLTLTTTGGTRQIDTDTILARYERKMLRAVLADFLTLGDQGVGSNAQSMGRQEFFMEAVNALMAGIADTITVQAIRRLCALNGIADDRMPVFSFNPAARRDIAAFAQTLATLASAGLIDGADADLRAYVYEEVGLPQPQQAEAIDTEPPAEEAIDGEAPEQPGLPMNASEPVRLPTPDQVALAKAAAAFDAVAGERLRGLLQATVVEPAA